VNCILNPTRHLRDLWSVVLKIRAIYETENLRAAAELLGISTPVYGSPTGIKSLDGWPDDIPRKLVYRLEMLEATLEICRLGLAAIFCPEFVAALQNKMLRPEFCLHQVPLPSGFSPLKRTVYIVKRKSDMEDSRVKKLAKVIRTQCALR
jgi:DNA-binding transcriptional LysR family regulator